jgi:hypothetical protein
MGEKRQPRRREALALKIQQTHTAREPSSKRGGRMLPQPPPLLLLRWSLFFLEKKSTSLAQEFISQVARSCGINN